MWLLLVLACPRTPPEVDGSFTATFGDDDDNVPPGDDDDDVVTDSTPGSGCDPATAGVDCTACEAAGLWVPTQGLTGDALVAELHQLTADHWCNDYSAATTWMFVTLDNEAGWVECVYTGDTPVKVTTDKPDGNVMNTEHTWPQSEGADVFPAECDLHHLYPTVSAANSARGSHPFGVVASVSASFGESLLGTDASGQTVFEPRDVHKGNVARSMLYFSMRYGYPLEPDQLALFQQWGALDPVDEAELARTQAIGVRQGDVNPYVTCPWLVDAL
jgi:deoxyribonuclease-1